LIGRGTPAGEPRSATEMRDADREAGAELARLLGLS
jgi:hypothetical protein